MNEIPDERVELRTPPKVVSYQFIAPWGIVAPAVYRYEDRRWIDEFFETGKLRLSTFRKFSTYSDEFRGDRMEGTAHCYGETAQGISVGVFQSEGLDALVFCCSHRLSRALRDDFGRDGVFEILNTPDFAFEIARQLVGFQSGLEGSCIYRHVSMINRGIDFDVDKYAQADGSTHLQMVFDAGRALGGPELLLLKRATYARQQEYRLLWNVDVADGGYVDVVAPRARVHCRRVKEEEFWD